jgi:hypothetical protein
MRILDMSAGNRAVWFDKQYRDAVYVDIRPEMEPDVVCDTRNLPFGTGEFDLIAFDPPHCNFGATSEMAKTYGHFTAEQIRDIVKGSAREAHRVSKADALMAFKWNDHDQRLNLMLELMGPWWEPLFGANVSMRTKHASMTSWVLLRRKTL